MKKLLLLLLIWLGVSFAATARVIYVKWDATGLKDGSSWANAYTHLPIVNTPSTTNRYYQYGRTDTFWVANGVYKPGDSVESSFDFLDSVKIFGGFIGTETALSQRNWTTFQTILDGDVGVPGVKTDNCKRVVCLAPGGRPNDMLLDGFKIINQYDTTGWGGAVYCGQVWLSSTVTVANCLFTNNDSKCGAGLLVNNCGNVRVINCRFENNKAKTGGAIFRGWFAYIPPRDGSMQVSDCVFTNNVADYGGAVYTLDTEAISFNRCLFKGNRAVNQGGAVYDAYVSRLRFYNCAFLGNAADTGGAYFSAAKGLGSRIRGHGFMHCTISGNRSNKAATNDYALPTLGYDTLVNNIIWGNSTGSGKQLSPAGMSLIHNNLVQGGITSGASNTYAFLPQFVAPGSTAAAPFPSAAAYDYHLNLLAGAIDRAVPSLPAAFSTLDLDRQPRIFGSKADLGAYERTYCIASDLSVTAAGPLSFCLPDSVRLTASGSPANAYYWNGDTASRQSIWVKDSGQHFVITLLPNGCRGTASILVNAYGNQKPLITKTNNTLSVPSIYGSYQWYKAGTPINGATNASFSPNSNGSYKVVTTSYPGGCKDSASYNLSNLAVTHYPGLEQLYIYPNPVRQNATLHLVLASAKQLCLVMTDLAGKTIWTAAPQVYGAGQHELTIPMGSLPPGSYHYRLNDEQGTLLSSGCLLRL